MDDDQNFPKSTTNAGTEAALGSGGRRAHTLETPTVEPWQNAAQWGQPPQRGECAPLRGLCVVRVERLYAQAHTNTCFQPKTQRSGQCWTHYLAHPLPLLARFFVRAHHVVTQTYAVSSHFGSFTGGEKLERVFAREFGNVYQGIHTLYTRTRAQTHLVRVGLCRLAFCGRGVCVCANGGQIARWFAVPARG
jgi:hypothetical protein